MGRLAQYGFRVDEYRDLQGWRVVTLADVPLVSAPLCPADGVALTPLCALTSRSDRTVVRVGCCRGCGHVTYIDRPTQEWTYRYYLETWDAAGERGTSESRAAILEKLRRTGGGAESPAVQLARGLPIDRGLPVCEIGCGFGGALHRLAADGFTRLVATEASRHRAEIAGALGFDVLTTPFESPATHDALRSRGPFALILTSHVLEHTYAPEEVFAAAAALQEPGGHLIVSVPNQEGEPSMGVLLFLPHLHSFTPVSLARLAARSGYEVVDGRANTAKNLNMVFRRSAQPPSVEAMGDPYARALDKLVTGLELDAWHVGRRRLWWMRRADVGGQVWAGPPQRAGEWNWYRFTGAEQIDRPRSVIVTSLRSSVNGSAAGAPIEIQHRGPVGLFFK